MIDAFHIQQDVALHIKQYPDLLERVATISNEYTCAYINKQNSSSPVINFEEFDEGLLQIVSKFLQDYLEPGLREWVTVSIMRRNDDETKAQLNIIWNILKPSFVPPNRLSRLQ